MDNDTLIKTKVEEFTKEEKMFTSVDISNAIKKDGTFVSNKLVSKWLHDNAQTEPSMQNYTITTIGVMQDTGRATLYYPSWKDPSTYDDRDQVAMNPTDFDLLHKTNSAAVVSNTGIINQAAAAPAVPPQAAPAPDFTPDIAHMIDGYVTVTTSKRRIKIPGQMIRKLGWKPGDKVDAAYIETPKPLPSNLFVNIDYRVSIPRSAVTDTNDPIKVIFKKNKIVFEKA